jgi:hypothetical protein
MRRGRRSFAFAQSEHLRPAAPRARRDALANTRRRSVMRTNRSLAIVALGVFFGAGLLGAAHAQSTGIEKNPEINTCNTTPDVIPDPSNPNKRVTTPITPALLTSGQPCQQVVTTNGLIPNAPLANLQRGFDFYSWLTFIALNTPIDGKPIGKGPRPGGDAMTEWESIANYRPLADVMLANGAKPTWGTRIVPDACKPLDGPGKIVVVVGEEAWNQPFKTGPLIDQDGHYALFDILMNEVMFDYIADNTLYSQQGQRASTINPIVFPEGENTEKPKPVKNPGPGKMGAVMLKVSWRILDPVKDDLTKFHTADALVFFPGPPYSPAPVCVQKKLGMIGFHVGHKTISAPEWVWSSFEQVANVPNATEVRNKTLLPRYSFYSAACDLQKCPLNQTPPDPWPPTTDLKFHDPAYHSQIVREDTLPPFTDDIAELNKSFRALVKGTVWENYMLVATQWPTAAGSKIDLTGAPAPTYLANTTLETYSQGTVPLASSSCMACHGNATDQHVPALASDFTFILEKAQPQTAAK